MSDLARHSARGGPDLELAALHPVGCGEAAPEDLLRRLRSAPEVELAEASPRRKPGGGLGCPARGCAPAPPGERLVHRL